MMREISEIFCFEFSMILFPKCKLGLNLPANKYKYDVNYFPNKEFDEPFPLALEQAIILLKEISQFPYYLDYSLRWCHQ